VTGIVEGGSLILRGLRATSWAIELFNRSSEQRTLAMQEGYRDNVRHEWRLERERLLGERLADLEESDATRRKLDELLSHEFFWLLANYDLEAAREATDERRRMLAFASAGSVNLDLTIAQLARVERTIRELDPGDVDELSTLARATELFSRSDVHSVALFTSGCVWLGEKSFGMFSDDPRPGGPIPREVFLTATGEHVLKVLDGYIRARTP
jgi:hypothetical protein